MAQMIHAKFDIPEAEELKRLFKLNPNGDVQRTLDLAVIRRSIPYVPFYTGVLANSPLTASTPGKVIYPGPYARYLYYGKVMTPNIPIFEDNNPEPVGFFSPPGQKKTLTDRDLQYRKDKSPKAGSFWFERMKADQGKEIVEEVKQAVARR